VTDANRLDGWRPCGLGRAGQPAGCLGDDHGQTSRPSW
jgi:hypothetical protein